MYRNQLKRRIRNYFLNKEHNKSIKKIMLEGGLAGHMLHPYTDDSLTFDDIREIIDDAAGGFKDEKGRSKLVEKVDGFNIFFTVDTSKGTVDPHEDVYFARNASSVLSKSGYDILNVKGMFKKFRHHPGGEVFILGSEVIAQACAKIPISTLKQVFEKEISDELPENKTFKGSYLNTEIIYPPKPVQLRYDMPTISFHEIVDLYEVTKTTKSTQKTTSKLDKETSSDDRYRKFVSSFNRQNLNDVFEVSSNIVFGEEFEEGKHQKHQFKLMGSDDNRINVNVIKETEVQELKATIDSIQQKAGLDGSNTIGDMKAFYVKSVVANHVSDLKEELYRDYKDPTEDHEGLTEDAALMIAKFIVYCQIFKKYKLRDIEGESGTTGAQIKKYLKSNGMPNIVKFLTDKGLFNQKDNASMITKIGRKIISSYSESFDELVQLFFMLGTNLLEGLKSNLVAEQEISDKQGLELKEDLINALKDYYSLPEPEDRNNGRLLKNKIRVHVAKVESLIKSYSKRKGIDLDTSDKDAVIAAAENMRIDPIEGVVYNFKGKTFKFTGIYAPFNQIVGFNTAKSFAADFPRYNRKRIEWDIKPETKAVAILPGSFRPPHLGHKQMVDFYMNKGVDQFLIIVSEPEKEESMRKIGERILTAKSVIVLFNILLKEYIDAGKLSLIKSPVPSPIETTAAMLAVGSDRLKPGTDVYLCASQKIEVDKVAGTGETAVGSERPKVDSDRFNSVNERHNRDPELNIMDYSENACPPVTLPPQYIQDCKDLGIFQSLPSQASGKDSAQFHASDLRFLLNEVSQREDLIPLLVHYLGSEQVARQYLEFIF